MAFSPAIFCTPRASVIVTTAGRPSGMAATASATAVRNITGASKSCSTPRAKIRAAMPRASTPIRRPTRSRDTWSGVGGSSSLSSSAICPTAVSRAMAVTNAEPRPAATAVPEYTIEVRSARADASATAVTSFSTGRDSPVRSASSTRK